MLDTQLLTQAEAYIKLVEKDVLFTVSLDKTENSKKLKEFLVQITNLSSKLKMVEKKLPYTPSFTLSSDTCGGVTFAGVPLGHEFESFILALLQVGGREPKISDEQKQRILSIDREMHFETIVSLSCHNCPEVVQSLNIMAVLNPKISHTMIDGATFREKIDELGIFAVPCCFVDGNRFSTGKQSLNVILDKLGISKNVSHLSNKSVFDLLVIGGGPAGATASIYAARKGMKTGLIAEDFGGQVKSTLSIENVTGFHITEGPEYMEKVRTHVLKYGVEVLDELKVEKLIEGSPLQVKTSQGVLQAKTVVIATGCKWKLLGIPGEQEFKNKGVAYCTHCDGPLFKDKRVAIIGGGNSGVEAAIDMAGIAEEVLVLEFLPTLKADAVLQDKLNTLDNVKVVTNAATSALVGDKKLEGVVYTDRVSGEEHTEQIDGCFIQIGLVPTTEVFDNIDKNELGEIIVSEDGATSMEGVYAAGDCTNTAFKQILVAEGSGATAALGAFNYLMRL